MKKTMLLGICLGLLSATVAYADAPGPRRVCEAEGLECQSCWRSYGKSPEDSARFEACAQPLRDKGWAEQCSHRQGAGDQVFFCPKDVVPKTVTRGGGCGACELGAGTTTTSHGLALGLASLAAFALRRRRG
jgi:MYXO-CTERM domain-containing protein